MAQATGTTEWIAIVLGLYMMATALGMAREPGLVDRIMDGLQEEPLYGFLAGIVTLTLGGTVIGLCRWTGGPLSAVVLLIGWAALVEGMLLLAFRDGFIGLFARMRFSPAVLRAISGLCFIGGALLVWAALG